MRFIFFTELMKPPTEPYSPISTPAMMTQAPSPNLFFRYTARNTKIPRGSAMESPSCVSQTRFFTVFDQSSLFILLETSSDSGRCIAVIVIGRNADPSHTLGGLENLPVPDVNRHVADIAMRGIKDQIARLHALNSLSLMNNDLEDLSPLSVLGGLDTLNLRIIEIRYNDI